LEIENLVREKIEGSMGSPMIFEICEAIREYLSNDNDKIL